MDFMSLLTEYIVVVVVLACLIIGYLIKESFDFIPNKYIPSILALLGAVLNVIVSGFSVESIVFGAFMGLASTGLHQAFKQFIENKNNTIEEE